MLKTLVHLQPSLILTPNLWVRLANPRAIWYDVNPLGAKKCRRVIPVQRMESITLTKQSRWPFVRSRARTLKTHMKIIIFLEISNHWVPKHSKAKLRLGRGSSSREGGLWTSALYSSTNVTDWQKLASILGCPSSLSQSRHSSHMPQRKDSARKLPPVLRNKQRSQWFETLPANNMFWKATLSWEERALVVSNRNLIPAACHIKTQPESMPNKQYHKYLKYSTKMEERCVSKWGNPNTAQLMKPYLWILRSRIALAKREGATILAPDRAQKALLQTAPSTGPSARLLDSVTSPSLEMKSSLSLST